MTTTINPYLRLLYYYDIDRMKREKNMKTFLRQFNVLINFEL